MRYFWIVIALPTLFLFLPVPDRESLLLLTDDRWASFCDLLALFVGILLVTFAVHGKLWRYWFSGKRPVWFLVRICIGLSGGLLATEPPGLFNLSTNMVEWTEVLLLFPPALALIFVRRDLPKQVPGGQQTST